MALCLGSSEKLKINFNNTLVKLNLLSEIPIAKGVKLLSSDGFTLKDFNGLYLTTKEDE